MTSRDAEVYVLERNSFVRPNKYVVNLLSDVKRRAGNLYTDCFTLDCPKLSPSIIGIITVKAVAFNSRAKNCARIMLLQIQDPMIFFDPSLDSQVIGCMLQQHHRVHGKYNLVMRLRKFEGTAGNIELGPIKMTYPRTRDAFDDRFVARNAVDL